MLLNSHYNEEYFYVPQGKMIHPYPDAAADSASGGNGPHEAGEQDGTWGGLRSQ